MNTKEILEKWKTPEAILATIGVLFSGFLVASKYLANTCALTPSCYYLFGIPSCVFGFIFYIILLGHILANIRKGAFYVAIAGAIMAAIFTYLELTSCPDCYYPLLMPTCFWGGILFIIIAYLLRARPNA